MKSSTLSFYTLLSLLLIFSACKSGQKGMAAGKDKKGAKDATEIRNLDTLSVSASRKDSSPNEQFPQEIYRASYTRTIDIVHTKLDLSFDFEKEAVLGQAWLHITPIFDPVSEIELDAQYFDIHKLTLEKGAPLPFEYEDSVKLQIELPNTLKRGDTTVIYLDYTAYPGKGGVSGSSAITSSKGLFFIDPRNEDPYKPTQIWTQGETEHNSNWFPTVDKPNERTTQELALTVPAYMETLSNGVLVKSEELAEGVRKDHWKLDQPHAPYLFMIAAGDYAIVDDLWEDVPVHYYVEKDYEPYAAEIFDHTPEMLSFFSDILDYKYPWPKYDQVVVRDFVSGAMENTTAVIYGDFVQKYGLDLVGNDNDFIVAHEMFHHWFGDLVTCESWSNLTMNEGFANYSEYLWKDYKEGKDLADFHRSNEISGYLQQARQEKHPLIYFQYEEAEQMFDQHSYNKGGLVLHMLRHYLGDDEFFAGLNLFLERNAYTAVEAHDLRLAMEDISGEDLNWFFNQWYFAAGHPKLTISDDYKDGMLTVTVEQTQDVKESPAIFTLPTEIDIYKADGSIMRMPITIDKREQTVVIPMDEEPQLVMFDPDDILLAEITHQKSPEEYLRQYRQSSSFRHRTDAMIGLSTASDEYRLPAFKDALRDPVWAMRSRVIQRMAKSQKQELKDQLFTMAKNDASVQVRTAAMEALIEVAEDSVALQELLNSRIEAMAAGLEIGRALELMYGLDSAYTVNKARELETLKSELVKASIAEVYGETGDPVFIDFFDQLLPKQSGYTSFPFFSAYSKMAAKLPKGELLQRAENLKEIGMNQVTGGITRYAATKAIYDIKQNLKEGEANQEVIEKLNGMIETIKENETSPRLKQMYSNF